MSGGKRISNNLVITDLDVNWTNPLEHEKLIYQTAGLYIITTYHQIP